LRPRTAFLLGLALTLAVGFFYAGAVLYRTFIGLDPAAFPAGPWLESTTRRVLPAPGFPLAGLVLAILSLLAAGAVTFGLVRRAARTATDRSRRRFLTGAVSGAGAALAATAAGGALAFARAFLGLGNEGRGWREPAGRIFGDPVEEKAPVWRDEWKGARVRAYRRLGRTGFEVSDISLGTGGIAGEAGEEIVREALDRGVNYLDTAPDYAGSGSEQAIGRALRGRDRTQLFVATKFCTPAGHLPAGTSVADYLAAIEGSLSRLGTDYVDLVHVHSCDEVDRLMDPSLHEAFDRLRQAGKARFLGFSSHTPNLVQVADQAIRSGRFDVMMLAYHHGIWPRLGETITRAHREQDMGVVAMKTLKGAKHHGLAGFREHAGSYSQAAFRWVLANPDVSCLVISFTEPQNVDEYLYASGAAASAKDQAVLRAYDERIAGRYCPPHCGACLGSCRERLPIHDVFRYRMYFEDYGWEKRGIQSYARLAHDASACLGCAAPCAGACPVGIPIQQRMIETHELLTIS
jgi:aryl-alcohol dehydrogenase-like predicted oxidoreductase